MNTDEIDQIDQIDEELLRGIIAAAHDALIMIDDEGSIRLWSDSAEIMFGYASAEAEGHEFHQLMVPERYRDDFVKEVDHLKSTDKGPMPGKILELFALKKDQTEFAVELSISIIQVKGRRNVLGIVRDVTERLVAEKTLRESESKYRGLFEYSRDAIMTLAPPCGKFTSGNPAAVQMFGARNEEDFISRGPRELSPERQPDGQDSATRAAEMIETAMREGSHIFDWTHRRVGGEEFAADVLLTRLEQGGQTILQATVRDITERTRMVEEIHAFNNSLEQLVRERTAEVHKLSRALEESPVVVVITDNAAKIEYVNPKFVEVTGYTASEVMGRNPGMLKSGLHPPEFYQSMWQTILSGHPWLGELCNRRKNGEIYWELANIFTLRNPEGVITHFVSVKEDITDHKQAAAAMAEQNVRLKAALEEVQVGKDLLRRNNRLAALGRMSAGLIHEINNPLNYATQGLHLLGQASRDIPEPEREDFMDTLNDVKDGVARAVHIVSDLRGFTPSAESNPTNFAVRTEVDRALRFFASEISDIVNVEVDIPDETVIWGIPNQVAQVLVHLIQNALDSMQTKQYEEDVSPAISIATTSTNRRLQLKIEDNGPGIPIAIIDDIFDPFLSTKDVGQGMGLGLTICHRIMVDHGGSIDVHNEPGLSCEFVLEFPLAKTDLHYQI